MALCYLAGDGNAIGSLRGTLRRRGVTPQPQPQRPSSSTSASPLAPASPVNDIHESLYPLLEELYQLVKARLQD